MPGPFFRLSDLPDNLRRQAEEQLNTRPRRVQFPAKVSLPVKRGESKTQKKDGVPQNAKDLVPWNPKSVSAPPTRIARESKMSATEKRYQRDVLLGKGKFEPITLVLPGGGRYTADFLTIEDGIPTLTEVKGSYRLGSQGRAFTAFHEAAAAFPFFRFVWAEEQKGGGFKRSTIPQVDVRWGREEHNQNG